MVVFDPQSQELSLRDDAEQEVEYTNCPYCHRPLHEEDETFDVPSNAPQPSTERAFVDPKYFRMLAHSTPGSADSSVPSTPRRAFPALRSGGSRNVSLTDPPASAEFVESTPAPSATEQGIEGSSFLPGYFRKFFVEKRVLGRGGRGVVLLVEHFLDRVFLGDFACKRIPVGNDHDWLAKVLVEVQLLQRLNHQNLVSYRHVWLEDAQITKFGPSVPCVFILQQYCNAGDLHDYVHSFNVEQVETTENIKERRRRMSQNRPDSPIGIQMPKRMPLDEIFSFFRDITSGLHHLHTNGYIHRDLKPSNCLLHRDGQKFTVLVSDFGEVQATTATRNSTGATGTISYCAPEVLQMDNSNGTYNNFSTKSDIFSLGMIVYFMCFGKLPYANADDLHEENEDLDQLRAEISAWAGFDDANKKIRGDLPERLYRYLKRLLSLNPAERPSTDDILQGIKAGAGLEDYLPPGTHSQALDDVGPRFSSVDSSPGRRASHSRHDGAGRPVRPGLSQLGRHSSESQTRLRTTARRRTSEEVPQNAVEAGTVIRAKNVYAEVGSPSPTRPPPQSPRLMLPPPPEQESFVSTLLHHPVTALALKAALFLIKVFTLTYPCAPYATNAIVLYPLLCLAALELSCFDAVWSRSLMLLGLHFTIVSITQRWDQLCLGASIDWAKT